MLQLVAIDVVAQTFADHARKSETESRLCIGCFPELDGLRVYFVWDSENDLDMHVFGPGPAERREIYYGNRDSLFDSFGRQRCDDLGGPGKCEIRGERFIVARRLGLAAEPEPYCFGFRLFGSKKDTDPTFSVVVGLGGQNVIQCEGSIDRSAGTSLPEGHTELSPICATEFAVTQRNWAAMIELDPLHDPDNIGQAQFKIAGDLTCRAL